MNATALSSQVSHLKFHSSSSSFFTDCNMLSFQQTCRVIRPCVIRRSSSPGGQIVNRDRLIALFKRIQDSIAEEKSGIGIELTTASLKKGRKPKKEKPTSNNKIIITRLPSNFVKKSPIPAPTPLRLPELRHSSNNKLTRPPSNFEKKSPIPSPTPLRSNEHNDLKRLEEMKLSELKGVAKERGIKGYSKLNKSDLLQLLKHVLYNKN